MMTVQETPDALGFKLDDCKRFQVPFIVSSACPKLGVPSTYGFYCGPSEDGDSEGCGHEWKETYILTITLTPVSEAP